MTHTSVPERHETPDVSELRRRLDENATPGPCRRGVRPMRLAIADPPYLGRAALWYGGKGRSKQGTAGRAAGRGRLAPEFHPDAHPGDRTECPAGHPYDETNTYLVMRVDGSIKQRMCREPLSGPFACLRERNHHHEATHREARPRSRARRASRRSVHHPHRYQQPPGHPRGLPVWVSTDRVPNPIGNPWRGRLSALPSPTHVQFEGVQNFGLLLP